MKRFLIFLVLIVSTSSLLFSNDAIKGFDNSLEHKTGKNVDFSFDDNRISLKIESAFESYYSVKMIEDQHPGNLFGYCWQIEGPVGVNAKATFTITKSLMKGKEMPEDIYITRIHEGLGYLVSQENISVTETSNHYVISIEKINQFSIWGIFGSNPPVPTLSEWAAIVFGSLLLIVGVWYINKTLL